MYLLRYHRSHSHGQQRCAKQQRYWQLCATLFSHSDDCRNWDGDGGNDDCGNNDSDASSIMTVVITTVAIMTVAIMTVAITTVAIVTGTPTNGRFAVDPQMCMTNFLPTIVLNFMTFFKLARVISYLGSSMKVG